MLPNSEQALTTGTTELGASDDETVDPRVAVGSAAQLADDFATALVGGVPVAVTSMPAAVEWLHSWSLQRCGGVAVRLVNSFSIVSMHEDADYLEQVRTSGISFPDGAPVVAALRLIERQSYARRVRGPSFFVASLERSAGSGVREYFLGTNDETLQQLTGVVAARWPRLVRAGQWAPPFTDQIDDEFVDLCRDRVQASGADRVWVALGTPKQDQLAQRLSEALQIPCVAVGAAFDFLAGSKREAPMLIQRIGAEWVFRLMAEPRRLWRRYLVGNVRFIALAVRSSA